MLQNKAPRLILDLPAHFSASEALKKLGWKPLLRREMAHHTVFMYRLLCNHFCSLIPVSFNGDFHGKLQGREMTFVNPVPQEDGLTGRQLILVLISGTVKHLFGGSRVIDGF